MAKLIETPNIIWDIAVLPAITWLFVLRKNLGSQFIGQTFINAVILPVAAVFAPFPFTGQYVWDGSKVTLIYATIAMIRGIYEFIQAKLGRNRINIHSDSTGQPLNFWFKYNILRKHDAIARFGEPGLAAIIGVFFFFTGFDTFFGGLMLYTAALCAFLQVKFDEVKAKEIAIIRDNFKEAKRAQKVEQQVSSEKAKSERQNSGQSDDGFFEVR